MKLLSGLSLVVLMSAPVAHAASFHDGLSAYMGNHVAEAETIYAGVIADPAASARDRSESARELGRIAWLIDRDLDRSLARLETALGAGDRPCLSGALYIRVLREAGQAGRAAGSEARFLPLCATADDADDADKLRLEAIQSGLELAAGQGGAERAATLAAVAADLDRLSEAARAGLPANDALLALGLERGDPGQAMAGWRGYFWLTAGEDAPQGMAAWQGRAASVFRDGLKPDAAAAEQAALAELLMRAGFYPQAKRLAADADLAARAAGDPAWKRVAAYFHFREQVDALSLALDRKLARGGGKNSGPYIRAVKALMAEAARTLGVAPGLPSMTAQFGLYGTVGETDGYPSLHAGHLVQDDRRTVDQYGRHGDIHFIGIDNMVANGFESWLWDGRAGTGGWAEDDGTVVQVRSSYAPGPLKAWQLVQDTPVRRRALADLADAEKQDAAVLARQPLAYLPGLSARLDLQAAEQILARAREMTPGGDPAALRAAFLAEYKRAVDQHSIFIHEGRHVLDKAAARAEHIDSSQLEYRAKLSELALADYPRLALAAIDGDTIGTDSDHGRGNSAIMKAFGEWVAAHPTEVAGFDPGKPALMQIDKLSDAQIRAVARSLDPWVKP